MQKFNRQGLNKRIVLLMVIACIGNSFILSGCEPLRKKFVRQKKKDKESKEFVPVLEPIDYPAKVETSEDKYKSHFFLWQVWQKDLLMALSAGATDKKQKYLLGQVIVHVQELEKLVVGEQNKKVNNILTELYSIQKEYEHPAVIRNTLMIQRQLMDIDKQMRNDLRPRHVTNNLK